MTRDRVASPVRVGALCGVRFVLAAPPDGDPSLPRVREVCTLNATSGDLRNLLNAARDALDPAVEWQGVLISQIGTAVGNHLTATIGYDIALRPDHEHATWLDDVVVNNVEMFRAEDLGDAWFMCCYLRGGERIAWSVYRKGKRVVMETTEYPNGDFVYEDEGLNPASATGGPT